ncbi:MAG: hypothetical protein ABI411_16165 [Tahibacter sp.]
MKTRLVTTALVASIFFAVGCGLDLDHSTNANLTQTGTVPQILHTTATVKSAPARIESAVTLPEITVRPSREDVVAAFAATPERIASTGSDETNGESNGSSDDQTAALPRLNFDMPYYSFGKVLPNVSRE